MSARIGSSALRFRRDDQLVDLGHLRETPNRPPDHRQPRELQELLRPAEARAAAGRDDDGSPLHDATPSRFGRAKIIRPATV